MTPSGGPLVRPTFELTLDGALVALAGARRLAEEMRVPQTIVVVDAGGHLVAFIRMDGAKQLSQATALTKAQTAVSQRAGSGTVNAEVAVALALASGGRITNLAAGLPLMVEGEVVGAIGVGSGTGAQDLEVAQAGVAAFAAALGASP